jgi:transcription initiation factor TFIIB
MNPLFPILTLIKRKRRGCLQPKNEVNEEMQKTQHIERRGCPQCGNTNLITDEYNGEVVCNQCGLVVIEDSLNRAPEWRAFTLDEQRSKSRTGAPVKYSTFDKGLHTTIRGFKDASGRPLSSKAKRRAWRLRKWHNRTKVRDSHNRNLMQAMNELQIISEKLHVSSAVKELAAVIYRKALDENLTRGRSIAAIIAAAMYVACRFTKTPKTLKDIVKVSGRDKGEVSRGYRLIVDTLKIEMPSHDPLGYVSRIAEKTNIPGKTQGVAVKILRKAKRKRVTMGKDPVGVASAVLYIACQLQGEHVTQKEIAEAAGITEVTLRNRKKELVKKLELSA